MCFAFIFNLTLLSENVPICFLSSSNKDLFQNFVDQHVFSSLSRPSPPLPRPARSLSGGSPASEPPESDDKLVLSSLEKLSKQYFGTEKQINSCLKPKKNKKGRVARHRPCPCIHNKFIQGRFVLLRLCSIGWGGGWDQGGGLGGGKL